jgi:hypothetical protein
MKNCARIAGFLLALSLLLPVSGGTQESGPLDEGFGAGTVPEALRIPQRGEAPRYPKDAVIGELGRGRAPEEAYRHARLCLEALLSALPSGDREAAPLLKEDKALIDRLLEELEPVEPRQFRLGGGREEDDGTVSFLVRFLGREKGKAGELFLLSKDETWLIDDLLLEEEQDLAEIREAYRFDFSPYERFY